MLELNRCNYTSPHFKNFKKLARRKTWALCVALLTAHEGGGINDLKLIEYNSIRNAKNDLTSYYGRISGPIKKSQPAKRLAILII